MDSIDLDSFSPVAAPKKKKSSAVKDDVLEERAGLLEDDATLETILGQEIVPILQNIDANTQGLKAVSTVFASIVSTMSSVAGAQQALPQPVYPTSVSRKSSTPQKAEALSQSKGKRFSTESISVESSSTEAIVNNSTVEAGTKKPVEISPTWKVIDEPTAIAAPFINPQEESSSQKAYTKAKEKEGEKENGRGLKDYFKNFSGELISDNKPEGMQDVAGSAAGGVLWSAAMELKEASSGFGEIDTDDGSVAGILKKVAMDKTGLTALAEKKEAAKEKLTEKVQVWATGKPSEKLPEGYSRDVNGKLRDMQGKFVSKDQAEEIGIPRSLPSQEESTRKSNLSTVSEMNAKPVVEEKDQTQAMEEVVATLESNDAKAEKRSEDLESTIANTAGANGSSGDSLLSDAFNMFGGKDRKRNRKKGKRGKFGKIGGALAAIAGGGGLLSTLFGNGGAEEVAMDAVEDKAVSKFGGKFGGKLSAKIGETGVGKLGTKLGGKGAAKLGARAIPVVGQVLAAGMALKDGYDGWNDSEMQQEAFDLHSGQEASTGQKMASAVANAVDMGGLVSGGLSMLGADVDTADIAKGLYGLFSSDDSGIDNDEVEKSVPAAETKDEVISATDAKRYQSSSTFAEHFKKNADTAKTASEKYYYNDAAETNRAKAAEIAEKYGIGETDKLEYLDDGSARIVRGGKVAQKKQHISDTENSEASPKTVDVSGSKTTAESNESVSGQLLQKKEEAVSVRKVIQKEKEQQKAQDRTASPSKKESKSDRALSKILTVLESDRRKKPETTPSQSIPVEYDDVTTTLMVKDRI